MGVSEWVWRVYLVTNGMVAYVRNAVRPVMKTMFGIYVKENVNGVARLKMNNTNGLVVDVPTAAKPVTNSTHGMVVNVLFVERHVQKDIDSKLYQILIILVRRNVLFAVKLKLSIIGMVVCVPYVKKRGE